MIKLKKILDEIRIVPKFNLVKGKKYDILMWYAPEGNYGEAWEPAEGTVGGEEGEYWSLGWEYIGLDSNQQHIFQDIIFGFKTEEYYSDKDLETIKLRPHNHKVFVLFYIYFS